MAKPKPKTKRSAPRKKPNTGRVKSDRRPPDLSDYAAGIEFLELKDGRYVCRQHLLRNSYNKDGLSLQAIDCELDYAFDPEGDIQLLSDQIVRESGPDRDYHIRLNPSLDDSTVEKACSEPTPKHLIQPDDSRLADLIRAAPLAILQSFDAQDALARWTYAARYCHVSATRKRAKALIDTALPRKGRGPHGKADPDLPQLRQAYDDLCTYVKAIYTCGKAQVRRYPTEAEARTPEAVAEGVKTLLKHFPDAEALRDSGVFLDDIVHPRTMGPAPSDVAASYIGKRQGLSSSRISDLVGGRLGYKA